MTQKHARQAAILIDTDAQEVRAMTYHTTTDLNTLIHGYLEIAYTWPDGSVLFCDEEGMLKSNTHFFRFHPRGRYSPPLAGRAIIVGPEVEDDTERGYHTLPPPFTVEEVRAMVSFITDEQAHAWAKANASDAACTITYIGDDGREVREVLTTMGGLFASKPREE